MNNVILKTTNLNKKYGNVTILNNINMEVKQGDIYGLIGKNGAGKTTLLRIITGLYNRSNGEMELFNETSEQGLRESRRRTGAIVDSPTFLPYMSAKQNLEYYRIQKGIPEAYVIEEVLKLVGLEHIGNKKYKNFPLGMKQRLGLALSLIANPDLLILDEPINGLDPVGIAEFREILIRLNKDKRVTIIISSHVLSELSQIATCYGFIHKGNLIQQISANDLKDKSKNYVEIKVDDTKRACALIEQKLSSKNYDVLSNNIIRIYDYINKASEVAETLIYNNIKLYSLNEVSENLENYFVDLIGDDKDV